MSIEEKTKFLTELIQPIIDESGGDFTLRKYCKDIDTRPGKWGKPEVDPGIYNTYWKDKETGIRITATTDYNYNGTYISSHKPGKSPLDRSFETKLIIIDLKDPNYVELAAKELREWINSK